MRQLSKQSSDKISVKEALRREMRQNLSKSEQTADFLILYDAINHSSDKRSITNKNEIKNYLFKSPLNNYLKSCSVFDLDRIIASVSTKIYIGADDIIASKGDYIDFVYIILEGVVDVVYSESFIRSMGAKEILGIAYLCYYIYIDLYLLINF